MGAINIYTIFFNEVYYTIVKYTTAASGRKYMGVSLLILSNIYFTKGSDVPYVDHHYD